MAVAAARKTITALAAVWRADIPAESTLGADVRRGLHGSHQRYAFGLKDLHFAEATAVEQGAQQEGNVAGCGKQPGFNMGTGEFALKSAPFNTGLI